MSMLVNWALALLAVFSPAPDEGVRRVHGHAMTYPTGSQRRPLFSGLGDRQHKRRRGPHGWADVERLVAAGRPDDAERVARAMLKRERRQARRREVSRG